MLPCTYTGEQKWETWKLNLTTVFSLLQIPAVHYLPKLPLETLVFSLLPAHFSPLCSFILFRKVLFLVPWLCLHLFSLTNCTRDFHACSQVQPTKNHLWRKRSVWCTWFNSNIPTHFTLYCTLSSSSLFWRSHTSYYSHFFRSFTHWAPDALTHHWHPLGSTACSSPPLQELGHSYTSLKLLHLTMYTSFLSSIHLLQISASGKASDFLPDTFNTIKSSVFPATSPEAFPLGCRVVSSISILTLWSWQSPVHIHVFFFFFFGTACSCVHKGKTKEVTPSCPEWCTLHFQPCTGPK